MSKRSKKSKHMNRPFLPGLSVKQLNNPGTSKVKSSSSDNNLKTNNNNTLKTSLSIKSWSVTQNKLTKNEEENLNDLQDLSIDSDDCANTNLLKARDSLENLLKTERLLDSSVDTPIASTSTSPETSSPRSLPALNETPKSTVASKSLAYWDKPSAKSRRSKEKRKKDSKSNDIKCDKSGDDKTVVLPASNVSYTENHLYEPSRSVVFTNEVMVVYFNGENVVYESKEPLKKELEQQVRNKEMRKGHILLN